MAKMKKEEGLTIEWAKGVECPVRFTDGLFAEENETVAQTLREVTGAESPRFLLVADANVVQRTAGLGSSIGRYVHRHGLSLVGAPVVLSGGEKLKCEGILGASRIAAAAIGAGLGMADAVVVIGGGTVLDVAGYAAAQLYGGIPLVRVPTTVAAMVDAAFSERASVNLDGRKDALTVTSRPAAVLIDCSFAKTVLDGVWRGGLGEIVRTLAVGSAAQFKKFVKAAPALKDRDPAVLAEFVRECVAVRVKKGPSDFALWCAARLESMSGYKLPHGYAVPIAVAIECAYAQAKGILSEDDAGAIRGALAACGSLDGLAHSHHLLSQPEAIVEGLEAWRLAQGSAGVVLPSAPGKPIVEESPDRETYLAVIKALHSVSPEG